MLLKFFGKLYITPIFYGSIMIKAVIFDLDNTLIDFMRMKHMTIEAAASAMVGAGLEHKKERVVKKLFELYDMHGWEDQTIFQKYLQQEEGKIDYRILASGINAYRVVRTGFLEPFPHVIPTLVELKKKGIKLAIVSDAPKLKAWIRLTAMKIDHFFDVVVAFEDTKRLKPSKKPFVIALNRLKLKAEDCLMVGDMPERDIKGATKLGMKTCFAKYGAQDPTVKVKADYIVNDIRQILKFI
jgi:putative hydrolase of the HAD superfamily